MNIKRAVFAILFVVAGVGLAFYGVTGYQNQQSDIQQAVEVEGTVENTDIDEISSSSGSGSTSYQYEPVVEYTYTYDGQEYTSESVYPGLEKQFGSQQGAEEVASQYSSGQETTVYVNQENPSRAFLIREKQSFGPFMMIIGGIFFVVGGLVAFRRRDEIQ